MIAAPLLADGGFHASEHEDVGEQEINGYVADRNMKTRSQLGDGRPTRREDRRDPGTKPEKRFFAPDDFKFNDRENWCARQAVSCI
ncbi:MAG: hypothetical protein IPN90_08200 [Elusimicrobia bacterium]|nr:hypothetical protein [Elusimicrobiota bacterium]